MPRPKELKTGPYVPRSRGKCGVSPSSELLGCGKDVYKGATRYKGMVWHTTCLVKAVREGRV